VFSLFQTELFKTLLKFRGVFRAVGIFSLFINLLMLAPALYMLQVYDRVLPSRNNYTLIMLSLLVVGVYLLICTLEYIRSLVVIRVGQSIDAELQLRVYRSAYEQTLKRPGSHVSQALGDMTTLRQFLTGQALFTFFDLPWFPIYLVVICLFDPIMGLVAVLGTLVLTALAVINETSTKQHLKAAGETSMQSNQMASGSFRNAQVIEAMGMLENLQARWHQLHAKFISEHATASQNAARITAFSKWVKLIQQSMVLGVGAWLVLEDRITPGMMIAGSILMGKALSPVEGVIGIWKQWSGVRAAFERLNSLLVANPERLDKMKLPDPKGRLTFEGVTACAPGSNQLILRGVNFEILPGDVLCVIGPSASGKSSLARVMVGIWPALQGKARIDGADISQLNRPQVGPYVGYLPQEVELFSGTVAENIARFGQVDPAKVVAAAQMTGVHEMILRLPNGYDTQLGELGHNLSGGQRQRIGLARALYDTPALVVLDEPNSNLDEPGEAALGQAVLAMQKAGKTVVLITHRKQAIGLSNKLLVLREGQAVAFGPRDEVLEKLKPAAANVSPPPTSEPSGRLQYRVPPHVPAGPAATPAKA
jgi:ATP-binding cassette subfamily C exporter for protease/lipase